MTVSTSTGIDLLIARGPAFDDVVCAVETVAGIERGALKLPDDPGEKSTDILAHAAWASIDAYAGGDFAFKVALSGSTSRDYHDIARRLAIQLRVMVAWPDECTLAATAFVACKSDGIEFDIACVDAEPDGLTFRCLTLPLTRGDLNGVLSDALWRQRHSANERYEIYDRSLNNELDFNLCAVDEAILDTVRELGERGASLHHAGLQLDLRRFYPPPVRRLMRRAFGRSVSAPDLHFDEIVEAIWNAIPGGQKMETRMEGAHE